MKVGRRHRGAARAKGYQILKLESMTHRGDRCRSSRRARKSASACSPTSASEEFRKYLEKLRAEAIIEWKNAELKKAYDEGLQEPAEARRGSSH